MEARIFKTNRLGFRFDVYSWYFTTQRMSVDLDSIKDIDSETLFYSLLYGAYESYCRHSLLKRNRYSYEGFKVKIDSLPYKVIKELQVMINKSIETDKPKTASKKKLPNGVS